MNTHGFPAAFFNALLAPKFVVERRSIERAGGKGVRKYMYRGPPCPRDRAKGCNCHLCGWREWSGWDALMKDVEEAGNE